MEVVLRLSLYDLTGLKELLKISHDHKFPSKYWTLFSRGLLRISAFILEEEEYIYIYIYIKATFIYSVHIC